VVRLSPLHAVLNLAARLIALIKFSLAPFNIISTCMTDVLHWLPIASRIQNKILLSDYGLASKLLQICLSLPSLLIPQAKDRLGLIPYTCHCGSFHVEWPHHSFV